VLANKGKIDILKIKSLMALNNENQEDLAVVLGQTRGTVNRKMTAKKQFTLNDILVIAEHYKVQPGDLFSS
jgi:antitoxin component HigA of HigAB toxin-antitoxin module